MHFYVSVRRFAMLCVWDSMFLSGDFGKALGDFLWITDLANGQVVSVAADHLHLNTIHQTLQLVPDIPGSSHGAELDEVLIAPLCGVTALRPLREKKPSRQPWEQHLGST